PGPAMRPELAFAHLRGPLLGHLESSAESVAGEPRTSRLLDLPDESAILLRETFARSADGSPFELAFTWYRGDRVAIVSSGQAL
ncbi:MAG: alkanesulfonate metabolism utilization regulator, partial [Jatrophihabitantaceae bacterium]|nr:alkanesulfonate metabolism utilization regulator [Jatrophihabitantaceae bacterium]